MLVAAVATRNVEVQPLEGFDTSSPRKTTRPDAIPIRLNTTWMKVNGVMPTIIVTPPVEFSSAYYSGALYPGRGAVPVPITRLRRRIRSRQSPVQSLDVYRRDAGRRYAITSCTT